VSAARLNASIEAAALIRRAEAEGDFATVLHKGDAERGSILIVVRSRGGYEACLERTLGAQGYEWVRAGPDSAEAEQVAPFVAKRVEFDPDLWAIELDIAHPERFIAETIAAG
jgi:hypothetical protein